MDAPSLTAKPQPSLADPGLKAREPATAPAQAEASQTRQAVQAAGQAQAPALSPEQLEQLAGQMQEFIGSFNRNLQFKVDEDSGRNVVTVLDDSGEVIRQIPSEELLDVITRLAEASGGLIDIKV